MMINNNANAVSLPSHKYIIKGYGGESMDELDRSIVTILESNGRASNAEISRSLNVSEGTVRRRLKKLINDQIINIAALADPKKLGYESEALIGIQVDPGKVEDVAQSIVNLQYTKWISITTGTYDVFTWVALPTAEALGIFLRSQIGIIEGVRKTETFVSLQVVKR
jgi:Lrp/AsnC family transcriptional regulator for asnA, asnC and gidA